MKSTLSPATAPAFIPLKLEITIESQDELNTWLQLGNFGNRISNQIATYRPKAAYNTEVAGPCYTQLYYTLTGHPPC